MRVDGCEFFSWAVLTFFELFMVLIFDEKCCSMFLFDNFS